LKRRGLEQDIPVTMVVEALSIAQRPRVGTVAKASREVGQEYLDTKGRVGIWNGKFIRRSLIPFAFEYSFNIYEARISHRMLYL